MTPLSLVPMPPEILYMICSFLPPHNLTICARASKQWHSACIPHIWRTIHLEYYSQLLQLESVDVQAMSRNVIRIRDLYINPDFYSLSSSSPSTFLKDQELQNESDLAEYSHYHALLSARGIHTTVLHWKVENALTRLVQHIPSLRTFRIIRVRVPDRLVCLIKNMQSLETLALYDLSPGYAKMLLEQLPGMSTAGLKAIVSPSMTISQRH